jgi:hypothetical protein
MFSFVPPSVNAICGTLYPYFTLGFYLMGLFIAIRGIPVDPHAFQGWNPPSIHFL